MAQKIKVLVIGCIALVAFASSSFGAVSLVPTGIDIIKGSIITFTASGGPTIPPDEELEGSEGQLKIEVWGATNATLGASFGTSKSVTFDGTLGVATVDVTVSVMTKNGKVFDFGSATVTVVDKEVVSITVTPKSGVTPIGGPSLNFQAMGYGNTGWISNCRLEH